MPDAADRSLDTHFAFGENWASYAGQIGDREIAEAERGLRKLVGPVDLSQSHFLDIGCGSGIHSLAAKRLGAKRVVAVDLDPNSVATTQRVLDAHSPARSHDVAQRSVFDLDPNIHGTFQVVYSWGVLHHTGDMWTALRKAAAMVAPGGQFVFALYRRTVLCPLWKIEKRWYTKARPAQQQRAQRAYFQWHRLLYGLKGINMDKHIREYHSMRGMDFWHDVHDWLGGYPYESALPAEIDALMKECGLSLSRRFLISPKPGLKTGLLGSSCDEYVYARSAS